MAKHALKVLFVVLSLLNFTFAFYSLMDTNYMTKREHTEPGLSDGVQFLNVLDKVRENQAMEEKLKFMRQMMRM